MAKLQKSGAAGFNAGQTYYAKNVRIEDIVIDPELSKVFKISDDIQEKITQSMKKMKFDRSRPLSIQRGTNILLDGHTRLAAAKAAGLKEVPVVEFDFDNRGELILYTVEAQANRRNITSAEIIIALELIPSKDKRKNPDGDGRQAEVVANKLGTSASTVYQAQRVLKEGSPEIIQKVKDGDLSLKKAVKETIKLNAPKPESELEFPVDKFQGLPENAPFLHAAVVLLIESGQRAAAELLINHFMKKKEKRGFYDTLPEAVSAQLPRLPLVVQTTN